MPLSKLTREGVLLCWTLAICGCAGAAVPDPRTAGSEYEAAVKKQDATALYELLDEEAKRALDERRVAQLLKESQKELLARAEALAGPDATVTAQAELRFSDGEVVVLQLEDGRFRLSSAAAFPSGANTPVQALHELRVALSRRSYQGLLQVLSSDTRASVEDQAADLVGALEQPETLDIVVNGDRATVTTPGGHRIDLLNEDGIWKVRDFE